MSKDDLDEYLESLPDRHLVAAAQPGKIRRITDWRAKSFGIDLDIEDYPGWLEDLGRRIKDGDAIDLSHFPGNPPDKLARIKNALSQKGWLEA